MFNNNCGNCGNIWWIIILAILICNCGNGFNFGCCNNCMRDNGCGCGCN